MSISLEEIIAIAASWRAERTRLYAAFMASLSEEQRVLLAKRWEATKWIERCRRWEHSMERGSTPQKSAIRPAWPTEAARANWIRKQA